MNSDRGVHERMLLGELDAGVEIGRTIPVADGDNGGKPGFPRASYDLVAVGVELLAIEMCVRINKHVQVHVG